MRNLKKVGCLILCLALMMSVAVFNVGAAFSDQKDIQHTEAVGMCTSLNIIGGYPDGSYKPAGNITRAEMCKMVCVALNGGNAPVLGTVTKHTFSDVQTNQNSAWAEPYIESCYTQGIVSGIGGGLFNPSGSITGSQAAKMLLVALGYQANKETFTGASWELNVNVRASNRGLYKELGTMNPSAALTRDNAAQMIWNALQADEVEYKTTLTTDANGQLVSTSTLQDKVVGSNNDKIDLMTDKYATVDTDYTTGTLYKFTYNSTKKEFSYYLNNQDKTGERDGNGNAVVDTFKSATDYTAMLGQHVRFVAKDTDNVYGAYAEDSKVVLTGTVGSLPDLAGGDTNFKVGGVKYNLDSTNEFGATGTKGTVLRTPVYFFQNSSDYKTDAVSLNEYAGYTTKDVITNDAQKFSAIDFDGDGDIDFFMVAPFTVNKVNYVSGNDFKVTNITGAAVTTKFDKTDVNAYDGLAKDNYVAYTRAKNTATDTDTFVKATMISGKITSVDDHDASIDGTWYTFDETYYNSDLTGDKSNICKVGTTLTDAAVINGYLFDASSTSKKNITDYAVVMAKGSGVNGDQVKLLFSDGTKKVVDLNSKSTITTTTATAGMLVTYSKSSDNEYKLEKATDYDAGFDKTAAIADYHSSSVTLDSDHLNTVDVTKISNSSIKAGYINTWNIADDAVIFVQYDKTATGTDGEGNTIYSYSYKVITGAQMKKMNTSDFTDGGIFALASKKTGSTGTYNVDMAYVTIGTKSVNDADTYYGYVTAVNETQNSAEDTVKQVTVWTKDGEKKYLTDGDDITGYAGIAKRNVIEYKLNSDGEISEIVGYGAVDSTVVFNTGDSAAVFGTDDYAGTVGITSWGATMKYKSYEANKMTNNAAAVTYVPTTTTYLEPDDDIVYLYIENSDAKGVSTGTIDEANDADPGEANVNAGKLTPNAFVVYDKDGNILLVVYDVDNDMTRD